MVSDDGRESEPMIAFHEQNTDEAELGHLPVHERVCVYMCVCQSALFVHCASHKRAIMCLIQTSHLYQTDEFH